MASRKLLIVYWVSTAFVVLVMGVAGALFVLRVDAGLKVLNHLGYPLYFATLIGVTRLLAAAAVLAPVPRGLREWAYAGLTFDLLATIFSILASGLPAVDIIQPVIILLAVLTSYLSWRKRCARDRL
jgi:hypothetical protein